MSDENGVVMKRRMLASLATVVCAASTTSFAQAPPAPSAAFDVYLSQEASVRLEDGRSLHLVCMGAGSPTVILSAGAGSWSVTWAGVQGELAKLTRACAWDRPGFGFSSASPMPQNVVNTTMDLEAALSRGGVEGPYVMVGHSLGGHESLIFADRHRSSVAGMVLVDPGIPDHWARIGRSAPAILKVNHEIWPRQAAELRQCARVVRFEADSAEADRCRRIGVSPNYSKPLSDALIQWSADPARFETRASLVENSELQGRLALNPDRDYGSMPLIVLSSTIPDTPPPDPPERRATLLAETPRAMAEMFKGHEELAALSRMGVHRSVPDVNHFIHTAKPEVVAAAIVEIVQAVRAR